MKYLLVATLVFLSSAVHAVTLSSGYNATITPSQGSSMMLYMPRTVGNNPGGKMVSANSTQWLYFNIQTGSHFSLNPGAHMAVIMSGNPVQNSSSNYNEGRGITLGNVNGCVGVLIEHFNSTADTYPSTCTPLPLHLNRNYGIAVHASATGISYQVFNSQGASVGSGSLQIPADNTLYSTRRDIMMFEVFQSVPSPIVLTNIADGYF